MALTLQPFFSDETLLIAYSSLTLPSGEIPTTAYSVEIGFRNLDDASYYVATAPVEVVNGVASCSLKIPSAALSVGLHRWRTLLIDGDGNRIALDSDTVLVKEF